MRIINLTPRVPGVYNDIAADHITAPPEGWAIIPDGFPLPSTYPRLGSIDAEELTYTREVKSFDEDGNLITIPEKYTMMTVTAMTEGTLPPAHTMTAEEARAKRDKLLAETDWTQVLDAPISAECREAFRVYRQALRDITEQEGFPADIAWPVKPAVVKAAPDPIDNVVDAMLEV